MSGDIIYLFQNDICGEHNDIPKHAIVFGNLLKLKEDLYKERVNSLKRYKEAVENRSFPSSNSTVQMNDEDFQKFKSKI